jgi:hypothetical protein
MLVKLSELNGTTINALDGDIGKVKDVYFDDRYWTIRFLVVDIQPWIPFSHKTLISPIALGEFTAEQQMLNVSISKDMVKNSPGIDEFETVSREFEKRYFDYYGYGYYWMGAYTWGEYASPTGLANRDPISLEQEINLETTNHLRSANEITHYGINALDGTKGYVKDFIWDTYSWSLRYLVVDTRDWLPGGKKVLIAPTQLESLNWEEKTVTCNMSLQQIQACPEYDPAKLNDLEYLAQVQGQL